MRQKICLMALIESVFKRGAYERTLSFHTIAEETRLPAEEVEHLVMKGLRCAVSCQSWLSSERSQRCHCSLGLIKGHLDQVEEKAYFTWVQPRVLSTDQISILAQRLKTWGEKLHKVEERVAPEVTASS